MFVASRKMIDQASVANVQAIAVKKKTEQATMVLYIFWLLQYTGFQLNFIIKKHENCE